MTTEIHDTVAATARPPAGQLPRHRQGRLHPGHAATGKTFAMDATHLVPASEQGQLAEHRGVASTIATMRQLGRTRRSGPVA